MIEILWWNLNLYSLPTLDNTSMQAIVTERYLTLSFLSFTWAMEDLESKDLLLFWVMCLSQAFASSHYVLVVTIAALQRASLYLVAATLRPLIHGITIITICELMMPLLHSKQKGLHCNVDIFWVARPVQVSCCGNCTHIRMKKPLFLHKWKQSWTVLVRLQFHSKVLLSRSMGRASTQSASCNRGRLGNAAKSLHDHHMNLLPYRPELFLLP